MQREIGDAVNPEDDGLAIDDELTCSGFSARPRRSRDSALDDLGRKTDG
jgi:hypothetical protein